MKKIDKFFSKQDCDWFLWYHSVLPETRDNGLTTNDYDSLCTTFLCT